MKNTASYVKPSNVLIYSGSDIASVQLVWEDRPICPSDALVGLELAFFKDAVERWEAKLRFNGPRAKPLNISLVDKKLCLTAGPYTYAKAQALYETFNRFEHLRPLPVFSGSLNPHKTSSSGLGTFVISEDGQFLHVQRSKKLHFAPGVWSLILGEGLEPDDYKKGDILQIVARALHEELGLSLQSHTIPWNLLCVDFETSTYIWEFRGVVDFRGLSTGYTAERLLECAAGAPDAEEHEQMQFLPLEALSASSLALDSLGPKSSSWDFDLSLLREYVSR